jgi:hypothetical protein
LLKIFFLFCPLIFYGQLIHHQAISAQGASFKLNSGLMVTQTIGQQSSIGTARNPIVVQQGFQQSFWATLIDASTSSNPIQFITYPNPFVSTIQFQFSNLVDEEIIVLIYDIQGRIVFNKEIKVTNGLLSIDLSTLANATYLVRLSTNGAIHYCKIIKNL